MLQTSMNEDITSRRIMVSHDNMLNYVFRFWTYEMININYILLLGNKAAIWYVGDENQPVRYRNVTTFIEKGSSDEFYAHGWMDLERDWQVQSGDEVGLYCNK
ncbi:hypothetical protein A4A49_55350 [Nicotiana attenuata]|uniref:Uncharacterized protein n=1 Tax=Nicotiana attenuata TaxID=49451 RepID=A0A314KWV5_NICAT|nr:hypothetical protein A4A49_55350 [Nicotiana attenuata]